MNQVTANDPTPQATHVDKPESSASHNISLAVWGVDAPVEAGSAFKITVGAKCTDDCQLTGSAVQVLNTQDEQVGSGLLGAELYSPDVKLYWTEIELVAPAEAGSYVWQVRLSAPPQLANQPDPSGLAETRIHPPVEAIFSFSVVAQASCQVRVTVIGQDNLQALEKTRVMLRPHSAFTDENGVAVFAVAVGTYRLFARCNRYEDYDGMVEVTGDMDLQIELEPSTYEEDYRGNLIRVRKS